VEYRIKAENSPSTLFFKTRLVPLIPHWREVGNDMGMPRDAVFEQLGQFEPVAWGTLAKTIWDELAEASWTDRVVSCAGLC
jgi:hypothetical protein